MKITEKFEKEILIRPAFDKRSNNPKEDYGIGSLIIHFILKGKFGAITTHFGTDMFLPETVKEYREKGNKNLPAPILLKEDNGIKYCWGIDAHSKKPMFKGHTKSKCRIIGKTCYCDGSCLAGDDNKLSDKLLREGSESVWKVLEKYYYIWLVKK